MIGIRGYLCLNLPLHQSYLKQTETIRNSCKLARSNQVALYLIQSHICILTKILPAAMIQVLVNYLTKKMAITITNMEQSTRNRTTKTVWGHQIVDAIYFTTPQSNIGRN